MYAWKILIPIAIFSAALAGAVDLSNFVKIGKNYYLFVESAKLNWMDATQYCRSRQANLISFDAPGELEAISNHLIKTYHSILKAFWIDGNDMGKENEFYSWSSGKPMRFAKWEKSVPSNDNHNKHCMLLRNKFEEYGIADVDCTLTYNLICENNGSNEEYKMQKSHILVIGNVPITNVTY